MLRVVWIQTTAARFHAREWASGRGIGVRGTRGSGSEQLLLTSHLEIYLNISFNVSPSAAYVPLTTQKSMLLRPFGNR